MFNAQQLQLLSAISHELRTPMTGVLGMTEALIKMQLPAPANAFLHDIKVSCEHALSLLNDLLDTGKIAAGKMQLIAEPFNLSQLITQTLPLLQHHAALKNLQLMTTLAEDVPPVVLGDKRALKQIVINLVNNAIKFTERGKIHIKIALLKTIESEAHIEMVVEDTGVGIPEEKLHCIFEPFSHVDHAVSRQHGGTGLGLSLCKHYLMLMKGDIQVQSTVGVGSQFCCRVPLALPAKESITIKKDIEVSVEVGGDSPNYFSQSDFTILPPMRSLNVLLVEDNIVIQKVHHMLFQELGCMVDVAESGERAFRLISQGKNYDAVFMDLGLPDKTGLEVARQIREWESRQKRSALTLIAITAYTQQDEHEACLDAGMDAVITKPIEMNELKCVLTNFLKNWKH